MRILGFEVKPVKAVNFMLTLMILLLASTFFHEYGHLIAIKLLGGEGAIESGMLNGVNPIVKPPQPWGMTVVCFMGGYFTALVFLILWYLDDDIESRIARFSIAILHLVYGTFEGIWYDIYPSKTFLMIGTILGIIACVAVIFICLSKREITFSKMIRNT